METNNSDLTTQELAAAGKTGPRITPERINALMERVNYVRSQPEGTTSTFMHAYLDNRFLLATGFSACVDPANFIQATGDRIAKEDAMNKAKNELWKLEGYMLFQFLNMQNGTYDTAGVPA